MGKENKVPKHIIGGYVGKKYLIDYRIPAIDVIRCITIQTVLFHMCAYIHSESYVAGKLKHRTISLVTEKMSVIAMATQSELVEKTASNMKELKARGAYIIVVVTDKIKIDMDGADYIINIGRKPRYSLAYDSSSAVSAYCMLYSSSEG